MNDEGGVERIDLEKVDWRGSREFFESLGETLDKLDDKDESYDFTWVGKRKSIIEAGAPINKTFRPDVEASKNWDTTENLFIEGDNLDALKLLQESYLGKVKMIYIDPPYNTGKDFVYRDNFKANVEQYDEDTEYKDDEGNIQFKKNEKSNGRYHSDWLSMMYPRLKLARNLLSDDGVIFISIDDNEIANLVKICDEIYGEDNRIDILMVEMSNTGGMKLAAAKEGGIAKNGEYILIYAKSENHSSAKRTPLYDYIPGFDTHFNLFKSDDGKVLSLGEALQNSQIVTDELIRFGVSNATVSSFAKYFDKSELLQGFVIENKYRIVRPRTEVPFIPKTIRVESDRWVEYVAEKRKDPYYLTLNNKDEVIQLVPIAYNYRQTDDFMPMYGRSVIRGDYWKGFWIDMGNISKEGGVKFENGKKPVRLIRQLAKWSIGADPKATVLDFFAGSATTAHAIMELNAEDGGSRKWTLVQLPEEADKKSEAYKAGYRTIPEISRERIRLAGGKIASENSDAKVDYGFRALCIDETNHKDVYRPAADYQQSMLDELVDNVKEDRSDLDLLYGVLTATAWELNKPLETVELDGATVYKYDYFGEVSGLVACFADEISEEAIKQIAQLKPLTAVFKESSFPNSQAKVNLTEHFRVLSPETKIKVI